MEPRSKSISSQKKDALRLARGLFESKVLVERPPTSAQKTTYNTVRSQSCAPRISSTKTKSAIAKKRGCLSPQPVNPVWRPFTGGRSLSRNQLSRRTDRRQGDSSGYIDIQTGSDNKDVNPADDLPRLPKGVEVFGSWISVENLENWTGISTDPNCFVILPYGFDDPCEYLPPLQTPGEPLLQRPVEEVKKYIAPKILHNFNYLESDSSFQCQHDQKQPAKLEQSDSVPRLRTCEIIKQEIEDLERLLQGHGNPNSSSIVNRYQHEITTLKQMVIETLREYNIGEIETVEEETGDPIIQGDLFQYLARHEEIITAIKEKRAACLKELARLEKELYEGR